MEGLGEGLEGLGLHGEKGEVWGERGKGREEEARIPT